MCRAQAQKLWKEKAQFEDAGFRTVCVVQEWLDREMVAFKEAFWQGPLYLDTDKQVGGDTAA